MTTLTPYNLTEAHRIYVERIAPLHEQYLSEQNAGGKMRASMGDLYEDVAQAVIYAVDPTVVCKHNDYCLLYTSPSPRDAHESRMPSSA